MLLVPASVLFLVVRDALNFERPRSKDDPLSRYTKWLGLFTFVACASPQLADGLRHR
jgi:hypothetical protein